jgi:hypothetical protein
MVKITEAQVRKIAKDLDIDLRKLPISTLKKGMQVELEHGLINPRTNVSYDDRIITAKIALAHIIEFPDYYDRLEQLEKEAKKYWKGHRPFNPFKQ